MSRFVFFLMRKKTNCTVQQKIPHNWLLLVPRLVILTFYKRSNSVLVSKAVEVTPSREKRRTTTSIRDDNTYWSLNQWWLYMKGGLYTDRPRPLAFFLLSAPKVLCCQSTPSSSRKRLDLWKVSHTKQQNWRRSCKASWNLITSSCMWHEAEACRTAKHHRWTNAKQRLSKRDLNPFAHHRSSLSLLVQ